MTKPFILESGRGRIIVNALDGNKTSITIDVNGAGHTIILNDDQRWRLAGTLRWLYRPERAKVPDARKSSAS